MSTSMIAYLIWCVGFLAGGIGASYDTDLAWLLSAVVSLLIVLAIGLFSDKT